MQAAATTDSPDLSESSYNRAMDRLDDAAAVRARIEKRITELNVSMRSVSRAIGQGNSYLYDFLRKFVPLRLPEDVRERLAAELGMDEEDLGARKGRKAHNALPTPIEAPIIAKWMALTLSYLAGDAFAKQKVKRLSEQAEIIAAMINAAAEKANDADLANHLAQAVKAALARVLEEPSAPPVDQIGLQAAAELLPDFLRALNR